MRVAIAVAAALGFARPGESAEPARPAALPAGAAKAAPVPPNLPKYDLEITLDNNTRRATIRERITWTNTTRNDTAQLVCNFYPHYWVPAGESLLFAKTLELLRLQPSLGIDRHGKLGDVTAARLITQKEAVPLAWSYDPKNPTALRFDLPEPVRPGQGVTVELVCDVRLPNKQGRLGHFEGVTYLTNSIPLLAVCDDSGWEPMPFGGTSRGTTRPGTSRPPSSSPRTRRSRVRQ